MPPPRSKSMLPGAALGKMVVPTGSKISTLAVIPCYKWRIDILIEAQRAIYIEYMRHPKPYNM